MLAKMLFLPAVVGLSLNGCSMVEPYPASWSEPQKEPDKSCIITGQYNNQALSNGEDMESAWDYLVNLPKLSHEGVIQKGKVALPAEANIEIRIAHGSDERGQYLDVSAYKENQKIESQRLRDGKQFRCRKTGIEIRGSWSFLNINVGLAWGRFRNIVTRDESGALIINALTDEAGLAFWVIPTWGKSGNWLRWNVVNTDPAVLQNNL